MSTVVQKQDRETLSVLARWGEVIIIGMMLFLLAFLVYHQTANTGFFTEKFGSLEMVCLYGPLLLGIAAPAVRAYTGRRNPGRPFEAATSLFLAAGSLWLLSVFPFSFAHLADALPQSIRFILAWVTDDIGRIPLILQVIIGPITAILTTWRFLSMRRQEPEGYRRQLA
jgi:hypothetical protein